ncbi:hypothetical protein [Bacillus solitudinis]|uniref:hypothetical protein n=1 Tax=Bacillus solitudinis TaxID=2014074 RepID=UPI000C250F47|nr:hypothetical protein [Bacillus solitudinis]
MTNFNQTQFSGSQAAFQQGFSGTDAQQVRQQNAQSAQPQFGAGSFQQAGQQGFRTQQSNFGQFSGPQAQAAFQSGFSGTDVQQVRQQNAQSAQPQFGGGSFQQGGQQGFGAQESSFGQYNGSQSPFQSGFSSTNVQQVRQQNPQSAQFQFGGSFQQTGQQGFGAQQSSFGQYNGPQSPFQAGFSDTDVQQVRQQNAQSARPHFGQNGNFQ